MSAWAWGWSDLNPIQAVCHVGFDIKYEMDELGYAMEASQKNAQLLARLKPGNVDGVRITMQQRTKITQNSLVPAANLAMSVPGTTGTGPVSGPTTTATLATAVQPMERAGVALMINRFAALAERTGVTEASARAIYQEGQQIIKSAEFDALQQAYKQSKYAEVIINGRKIAYEPGIPTGIGYNAVTDTPNKGFALGADAFSSQQNLTQTVYHEVTRLKMSEALKAGEITAETAKKETAQADTIARELTSITTGN